ncbi:AEC family transporter [Corynebacterium glutamicum]|uniref:AEC family transporter n=1 Tax=Corynebacterium TaxID=1716 RepID=UPI000722E9AD|nr:MULTISPECIES: AEC family transporter [Corynebacterium]ALP50736.1 permease [Corynebacterium glutamicum]ANR63161.1 permease [[Brevibacterium] flavum ZL-1]ANR66167.1 permease [Corynebacterium glutamicum ZL-6]ANU34258.1 permease [Corynebacterium glutamicum]APT08006.1 permease [Corynebacterium glutamicum]
MQQVLMGFTVVFIVIGIGWILGRRDTLGTHAQKPLSLFVYYVATPALLFDRVTKSDTSTIFSLNFVVITLSALIVGFLFFLLMRFVIKRTAAVSVIGMLAASYANAGNLGIPLAAYILDDFTVVIPVILFQVAFYAPITMTIMEMLTNKKSTNLVRNLLVTPLTNTMVLAAIAGIAVSLTSMSVPVVIAQPVEMLANASVPLALVVFGLSLSKSKILEKGQVSRRDVFTAALFKNVLHPIVAGLLALAFGMEGTALLSAVILGALPTAQNVYTYALRFRTAESMARDTGVVTTLISFPVLVAVSIIFGS